MGCKIEVIDSRIYEDYSFDSKRRQCEVTIETFPLKRRGGFATISKGLKGFFFPSINLSHDGREVVSKEEMIAEIRWKCF